MNDSIQQQSPDPLYKSDVPWYNSGIVMKLFAFGMPISLIWGTIIHRVDHRVSLGLLDGMLCGLLGFAVSKAVGRLAVKGFERDLRERKYGKKWYSIRGLRPHDILMSLSLLGTLGGSALIGYELGRLGLTWPWVGASPTAILAGYCGLMCPLSYQYAKWYDDLQD